MLKLPNTLDQIVYNVLSVTGLALYGKLDRGHCGRTRQCRGRSVGAGLVAYHCWTAGCVASEPWNDGWSRKVSHDVGQ
jgi:hypothetical protein